MPDSPVANPRNRVRLLGMVALFLLLGVGLFFFVVDILIPVRHAPPTRAWTVCFRDCDMYSEQVNILLDKVRGMPSADALDFIVASISSQVDIELRRGCAQAIIAAADHP